MAAHLRAMLCLALFAQGSVAAVLRTNLRASSLQPGAKPSPESYSFAQFIRDFERSYEVDSEEYRSRSAFFQASLERIHAVNAKNQREGRAWTAGVHPFMDFTEAEKRSLNGYKHSPKKGSLVAALQTHTKAGMSAGMNSSWAGAGSDASWEGVALRQQGSCGSCWAISAVEAIEARLPGKTRVSAQALVDCVPNPRHCGGKGGCDGATGELAYEFARDHGLPLESNYAYTAETGSCPMNPLTGAFPAPQRARVSGWANLESNKAQPLMEALYSQGPVVVAVDANDWFDYDAGVFDGCQKDATLGHAVLAKGYGGEGNGKFWRIQNSWGANWGEQGHIRLKREENAMEEARCGQDRKPSEGLGCDGGPPEITVCGMCGILYDPIYPTGVTIEGGDAEPRRTPTRVFQTQDMTPPLPKPFTEPEAPVVDLFKTDDVAKKTDEDRMRAIFQSETSAAENKKNAQKSAVDQMQELLSHN